MSAADPTANPRRIFLVGFMASGKTSLGALVAPRLSLPFFDLDDRIVMEQGRGIASIFDNDGETAFRGMESEALKNLIEEQPAGIIATGGGAFTLEENRDRMEAAGLTVWIDVPLAVLLSRNSTPQRPLWGDDAQVRALAEKRRPLYRLAKHYLDVGSDSLDMAAERLYQMLVLCSDKT